MKKKKGNFTTLLLILVLLSGLSLLLYPSVSDYWNSFHQTRAIATYAEEVANLNQDQYDEIWAATKAYNASLAERDNAYLLSDAQKEEYARLLDISGLGIMGYIEIPEIDVSLPVYHGTEESVLQIAVGHLDWSSLPVGGESTHCVLSGHRGLPSAKLFTNLDKLREGDIFLLRILDEVLTYEVDQILIVEPQEVGALQIVEGQDYCTLVTCTPYGINTHRLLVRGHRIDNVEEAKTVRVTADAVQIEPLLVAPIVAIPILLLLLLLPKRPKTKHGGDADEDLWQLSNNNAEIRRLKGRIEELTRHKEAAYVGWEFEGGTVEINREANRLQIYFEGKPDATVRDELKSNGFRWSPKAEAWQRQLNDTTIRVTDRIKCIQPLSGEKPSALQLAARREKEKPSIRAQLQASKAEQGQKPPAREKSKGLEVE